jgi:hypothetical protein
VGLLSFLGRSRRAASAGGSAGSLTSPARAEAIVNDYGAVLIAAEDTPFSLVLPESQLRHSRDEIKSAIRYCLAFGPAEVRDSLVTGYSQLGSFVPDADAALAANLAPGVVPDPHADPGRALAILKSTNAECARLLAEISSFVDKLP